MSARKAVQRFQEANSGRGSGVKAARPAPTLEQRLTWVEAYGGEPIPEPRPIPTSFEDGIELLARIDFGVRRLQNNLVELLEVRDTIRHQARLLGYRPGPEARVQ